MRKSRKVRRLIVVLGDQLDAKSAAFDEFEKDSDAVWMAEVSGEANFVWSHKARIALFLSAMRHFRDSLRKRNIQVEYRSLDDRSNSGEFAEEFEEALVRLRPDRIVMLEPGEWRVKEAFQEVANRLGIQLEIRADRHFLATHEEFADHARGRKQLRLEYFYRELRRKHTILMDGDLSLIHI